MPCILLVLALAKGLGISGVWIRWTGTVEWNGGMDWTGMEWNDRMLIYRAWSNIFQPVQSRSPEYKLDTEKHAGSQLQSAVHEAHTAL